MQGSGGCLLAGSKLFSGREDLSLQTPPGPPGRSSRRATRALPLVKSEILY